MPAAAKISAVAGMGGTPLWATIVVVFVLVVLLLLWITAWRRGWFKIEVKLPRLVVKLELNLREKTP